MHKAQKLDLPIIANLAIDKGAGATAYFNTGTP
jgi:hypothetical protein